MASVNTRVVPVAESKSNNKHRGIKNTPEEQQYQQIVKAHSRRKSISPRLAIYMMFLGGYVTLCYYTAINNVQPGWNHHYTHFDETTGIHQHLHTHGPKPIQGLLTFATVCATLCLIIWTAFIIHRIYMPRRFASYNEIDDLLLSDKISKDNKSKILNTILPDMIKDDYHASGPYKNNVTMGLNMLLGLGIVTDIYFLATARVHPVTPHHPAENTAQIIITAIVLFYLVAFASHEALMFTGSGKGGLIWNLYWRECSINAIDENCLAADNGFHDDLVGVAHNAYIARWGRSGTTPINTEDAKLAFEAARQADLNEYWSKLKLIDFKPTKPGQEDHLDKMIGIIQDHYKKGLKSIEEESITKLLNSGQCC